MSQVWCNQRGQEASEMAEMLVQCLTERGGIKPPVAPIGFNGRSGLCDELRLELLGATVTFWDVRGSELHDAPHLLIVLPPDPNDYWTDDDDLTFEVIHTDDCWEHHLETWPWGGHPSWRSFTHCTVGHEIAEAGIEQADLAAFGIGEHMIESWVQIYHSYWEPDDYESGICPAGTRDAHQQY